MDVIEATGRISKGRTFVQLKEGKTHLSLFCTLLFSLHIYNCVVQPLSPALAALGFFLSSKPKWSNHWTQHPKTSRQTPNQGTFPKKQAIHLIEQKHDSSTCDSKASIPYPDVLQSPEPPRRRKRRCRKRRVQGVGVVVFGEWRVRHASQKGAEKKAKRGNLRWLDLKD